MKYGAHVRRRPKGRVAGALGFLILAALIGALVLVGRVEPERESPVDRMAPLARSLGPGLREVAQTRRIIVLGVHVGTRAGTRVAIQALDSLALGPGLDAVGVWAPAEAQSAIDRYLTGAIEDPTLLPEAASSPTGLRELLRAVRAINDELGVDRALRVIALDPPDWPPAAAASPANAVVRWAGRSEYALSVLSEGVLAREPNARLLLIVDGLDALREVRARAGGSGGGAHAPTPLAALLRERYGRQLYAVLVDGAPGTAGSTGVVSFDGTSLFDDARRTWSGEVRFVPLRDARDPGRVDIGIATRPGIGAELQPSAASLAEIVDAYVYPGVG
ncbi:MAG TPA: hypothetical protein VK837_03320 [Longimicrobiales bacterium]|nr:hypothetical protein [Longimicrobiales bacterium]